LGTALFGVPVKPLLLLASAGLLYISSGKLYILTPNGDSSVLQVHEALQILWITVRARACELELENVFLYRTRPWFIDQFHLCIGKIAMNEFGQSPSYLKLGLYGTTFTPGFQLGLLRLSQMEKTLGVPAAVCWQGVRYGSAKCIHVLDGQQIEDQRSIWYRYLWLVMLSIILLPVIALLLAL